MKRLTGKVAVVTGASKGIGAAVAKQLAADGAKVVVNYATSREGADKVVKDITKAGGEAIAVRASIPKEAEIDALFVEARKAYGKVDILVNNAGVYGFGPIDEVTVEEYRRQHDTNVLGIAYDQGCAPVLSERGRQCGERQLGGKLPGSACRVRVCIHEGSGRHDHKGTGKGTRRPQDSRECGQPGAGDHRRR